MIQYTKPYIKMKNVLRPTSLHKNIKYDIIHFGTNLRPEINHKSQNWLKDINSFKYLNINVQNWMIKYYWIVEY